MKPISNLLSQLAAVVSLSIFATPVHAQNDLPEVGFVRIIDGIAPGTGLTHLMIDGEDIFPKGYQLGQSTGGLGIKAGPHRVTFQKAGVKTGTTQFTLLKGETISLIGFAEQELAEDQMAPPRWKTKILKLKQSDPTSGYQIELISLCPQDELRIQTETQGENKIKSIVAKRMIVTRITLGKSKVETLMKLNREILTVISPEEPGTYVVVLYQDETGKVKAISFHDPKFTLAG